MIVTADIHVSIAPLDMYRWKLFPYLRRLCKKKNDYDVVVNGDLTEKKDCHPAELVRRMVEGFCMLADAGIRVHITKGNHDYIEQGAPFFGFLDKIEGIHFYSDWEMVEIQGHQCLMLPHTRHPARDWEQEEVQEALQECDIAFIHQSVIGSATSSGYGIDRGLEASYFDDYDCNVIAGDIHVPQKVRKVLYTGSPYSIAANDDFDCRILRVKKDGSIASIKTDFVRRRTLIVSGLAELKKIPIADNDQVKVRMRLRPDEVDKWVRRKRAVQEYLKAREVPVLGIELEAGNVLPKRNNKLRAKQKLRTDKQVVDAYCKTNQIPSKTKSIGRRMVD